MKLIAVLLALLIAALPVPASACASVAGDGAAIAAGQAEGGDAGHDCCPGEADEVADEGAPGCDGADHCDRCMAPGGVLTAQFALLAAERPQSLFAALTADLFPSHDAPPFRPPIS